MATVLDEVSTLADSLRIFTVFDDPIKVAATLVVNTMSVRVLL